MSVEILRTFGMIQSFESVPFDDWHPTAVRVVVRYMHDGAGPSQIMFDVPFNASAHLRIGQRVQIIAEIVEDSR